MKLNKRNALIWAFALPTMAASSVILFGENSRLVCAVLGFVFGLSFPLFEVKK